MCLDILVLHGKVSRLYLGGVFAIWMGAATASLGGGSVSGLNLGYRLGHTNADGMAS